MVHFFNDSRQEGSNAMLRQKKDWAFGLTVKNSLGCVLSSQKN
jgi:hypothetical protein